MKKINRREFLRILALGAGSAAVAQLIHACAPSPSAEMATPSKTPFFPPSSSSPTNTSAPVTAASDAPDNTAVPSEAPTVTEAATSTMEPAYLAMARGGDNPGALVRSAIAAIGGMERFVPPGSNVIIKPNICTPRRSYTLAATTNPWVVGELVRMCREAGAERVRVFDYPFNGPADQSYADSGITEQVLAAGGEMEYPSQIKFVRQDLPGTQLGFAYFYDEVLSADVLIDVPILKQHGSTGLTLAMKNLMGTIRDRGAIHNVGDIHRNIADLAGYIRPELTVVDAIRMLVANGPTGGRESDVRKTDAVIASADIVAADAYAAKLFGYSDPNSIRYIFLGAQMGIGRSDVDNLNPRVIDING